MSLFGSPQHSSTSGVPGVYFTHDSSRFLTSMSNYYRRTDAVWGAQTLTNHMLNTSTCRAIERNKFSVPAFRENIQIQCRPNLAMFYIMCLVQYLMAPQSVQRSSGVLFVNSSKRHGCDHMTMSIHR